MQTRPKREDNLMMLKRQANSALGTTDTSIDRVDEGGNFTKAEDHDEHGVVYKIERRVVEEQLPLPEAQNETRVKAVVSGIDNAVATLACQLPHDRANVEVPIGLLPNSCIRFGAPVWVSVDTEAGFRQIKIVERHELSARQLPEDAEAIAAWIAGAD